MKQTSIARYSGLAATLLIALPLPSMAQRPKHPGFAHYTVTDLGTLGGAYSFGYGVNNAGVVAGASATATQIGDPSSANPQPPQTGFLWKAGRIIDLGTLGTPGLNLSSEPSGPNIFNEAALVSELPKADPNGEDFCYFGTFRQCVAAIWKKGKLTALPNALGGTNSNVFGINDRGQVIGFAETSDYDPSCATPGKPYQVYRFKTVIWEPDGTPRVLQPYPGDTVSFGFGINNRGQAVGGSGVCSNTDLPPNPASTRSVLWEKDGTVVDLGGLGGSISAASAINDRGDVDGAASDPAGNVRPYLWTREWGKPHNLGALHADDPIVLAPCCNTVNRKRQVVGFDIDANFHAVAFLWQDGTMVDLNDLIPADSPWNLQNASSINDAGQITGVGTINGNTHAFLATPCTDREEHASCEIRDNDRY